MPEKMIAKMIKKPGTYSIVVDNNFKVTVTNMLTTYSIEVDNNFDNVKVKHNGVDMTKIEVQHPDKHDPRKPAEMHSLPPELKAGCVGLVGLVPDEISITDECRFVWGKWF